MLWRRYNRVLKQRNAALRQSDKMVVQSLDPQFTSLGEQLHLVRKHYAGLLNGMLQQILPVFSQTLEGVTLKYRKGWAGDNLAEAIQISEPRDMERGATGSGPHRADLYLSLDGVPAKERLSRGEQKAMTAAMIISQARMICESGEKPILMLDDLSSELDEAHLGRVLRAGIELDVQLWVTGTELAPAIKSSDSSYTVFHVEHGGVSGCGI